MKGVTRKFSALESIRKFCVVCMGGSYQLIAECPDSHCPLHDHRLGEAPDSARPPVRAIRRQCLLCCGGDRDQVRTCPASSGVRPPYSPCYLWRYRLGSRPEIFERRKKKARRTLLTLPGLEMGKASDSSAA